jgi:serine/threonine protein kinase
MKSVLKVVDAVDKLHKEGFLHLDIRPTNIVYNGEDGKLIDFGLMAEKSSYYGDFYNGSLK